MKNKKKTRGPTSEIFNSSRPLVTREMTLPTPNLSMHPSSGQFRGLQAAYDIQKADLTCFVLEASGNMCQNSRGRPETEKG
jgi:hypothetical protein